MDPEAFSYANLGDRWGSWLKYAGYDGLVVRGKTDKPVYLSINNDTILIWSKDITHAALHASKSGKSLYEAFGFKDTNEMRVVL
jgi:aldehyde:ferredoxin oxidoreductase